MKPNVYVANLYHVYELRDLPWLTTYRLTPKVKNVSAIVIKKPKIQTIRHVGKYSVRLLDVWSGHQRDKKNGSSGYGRKTMLLV